MSNLVRSAAQTSTTGRTAPVNAVLHKKHGAITVSILLAALVLTLFPGAGPSAHAQTAGPVMLHPNLSVRAVVTGLTTPISMAFVAANDMLVLEKNSGKVQRIVNGMPQATVLDLAVNFASERGLLGIALHPNFPTNPGVYLYWTCLTAAPPANPFFPDQQQCSNDNMLGEDTNDLLRVPLLGNRVDRFVWDGTSLKFDQNLIMLRAFQHDAAPTPPNQGDAQQPPRGNHDGGVLRFGPDGKLYIIVGDLGRRGQMQNLPSGPTPTGQGPRVPDDQFGGPEPDNAHLTGVILRLNDNGTAPSDNPFYATGATMGGEVGANVQKIFAYGVRNSFGMDFDPRSGDLWTQENADDAFDELNRVEPGMNGGWIQIIGPAERIAEYKAIELSLPPSGGIAGATLQQLRWPASNLADTPEEARSRLFMLPGAHYSDPEFSWKYAVAPAAIGFLDSRALGSQFRGDLFVGASNPTLAGGYLFHFDLTGNRRRIAVDEDGLEDRVADNARKYDITESESLLIGTGFGAATDIQTGPDGHLYVVSLTQGAVYEIFRPQRGQSNGLDAEVNISASCAESNPDGTFTVTGNVSVRNQSERSQDIRLLDVTATLAGKINGSDTNLERLATIENTVEADFEGKTILHGQTLLLPYRITFAPGAFREFAHDVSVLFESAVERVTVAKPRTDREEFGLCGG